MMRRISAPTSGTLSPDVAPSSRARRASARLCRVLGQVLAGALVACEVLDDLLAGRFAEHQQVQQRIGAEAIGAMHRHAGALARRVKTACTIFSPPLPSGITTWPWILVGMPPIW